MGEKTRDESACEAEAPGSLMTQEMRGVRYDEVADLAIFHVQSGAAISKRLDCCVGTTVAQPSTAVEYP